MLDALRRGVLSCTAILATVAMAVLAVMMLAIGYDVFARSVLKEPTDWAYPLNALGVLSTTTLAMPYLYARKQHIAMDLLYSHFSRRGRLTSQICTAVVTALFGLLLTFAGFRSMTVAVTGGLTGSGTFSIPLWIADAMLTVSGAFLVVVAVLFPQHESEAV